MTEEQATAEARQRNLELGEAGVTDRFFTAAAGPDGAWLVEERTAKRTWRSRIAEAFFANSGSGSSGPNI